MAEAAPLVALHEAQDDAVILRVKGELDTLVADDLRSHLDTVLGIAMAHPSRTLIIELQAIDFLGSAGLNALLRCQEEGVTNGISVRLVSANRLVVRVIEMAGIDKTVPLYPTVDEALQAPGPATT